jgi:hypothetical protein
MLQGMQQEGFDSAPSAASFAGLLASLTAPKSRGEIDGLEDDVATLSYERALLAHARYRPAAAEANPAREEQDPAPVAGGASVAPASVARRGFERSGKRASVTVRMSTAEYAQLQRRAAEAGMTVSAYLRSCTFEAEALRAQVKQALAELRPAQSLPQGGGWRGLFRRRGAGGGASLATAAKTTTAG